jgi:hypothetical protein
MTTQKAGALTQQIAKDERCGRGGRCCSWLRVPRLRLALTEALVARCTCIALRALTRAAARRLARRVLDASLAEVEAEEGEVRARGLHARMHAARACGCLGLSFAPRCRARARSRTPRRHAHAHTAQLRAPSPPRAPEVVLPVARRAPETPAEREQQLFADAGLSRALQGRVNPGFHRSAGHYVSSAKRDFAPPDTKGEEVEPADRSHFHTHDAVSAHAEATVRYAALLKGPAPKKE